MFKIYNEPESPNEGAYSRHIVNRNHKIRSKNRQMKGCVCFKMCMYIYIYIYISLCLCTRKRPLQGLFDALSKLTSII